MRTVGSFLLPSGGRAFTVNGRTIRMTGGAWVPDYLMSWSAQRYRDEVRLMAEGNHTIVRVNGCGIVPPDVFFDACDRCGVLVWQDLSRTSSLPVHWHAEAVRRGVVSGQHEGLHLSVCADGRACWSGAARTRRSRRPTSASRCRTRFFPPWTARGRGCPVPSEQPPWHKEEMGVWSGGPYWHGPPAGILPPLCARPGIHRQE